MRIIEESARIPRRMVLTRTMVRRRLGTLMERYRDNEPLRVSTGDLLEDAESVSEAIAYANI